MKAISGKRLCQLLEARGWHCQRVAGSHFIYVKTGRPERISVPVHGNRALKIGLQRHLMKLAGIREDEL